MKGGDFKMDTEEYVDAYADILASVSNKEVALAILVEVAKKIGEPRKLMPARTPKRQLRGS